MVWESEKIEWFFAVIIANDVISGDSLIATEEEKP